jgi:hypothetical protein
MKKREVSTRRVSYWKWVSNYLPVKNPYDSNAAIDGCLLQPYGEQWEFVRQHDNCQIWTLVVTDLMRSTVWEISSGIHVVNRSGFLITQGPFIGDGICDIRY